MTDTSIYDQPSTPRAEYVEAAKDLTLILDLLAGTRRMHEKFKDYIAKFSAEKPANYKIRGTSAKVYGGLARTLSAAVGMLFAKPPQKSKDFETTVDTWGNIDGKGTGGDVFVKRRAKDAIAHGFCAILVDHPPQPKGVTVHAGNDRALGLRPIWLSYPRADVISWVTATIDNVETIVQVVLREGGSKRVGKFGVQPVIRYRVPQLVMQRDATRQDSEPQLMAIWTLLEEQRDAQGKVTYAAVGNGEYRDKNGLPFTRIPIAPVYSNDSEAAFCAQPPLLDVAWANLEHWRVATELRHYERMCAVPQPTLIGELAKDPVTGLEIPFAMGPTTLVRLKDGGDFKIVELQGSSLEQLRRSLEEKKNEIGELGLSFLTTRPNGVESAEKKRLDATAENATLGTSAQGIQDGINLALEYDAQYRAIPKEQAATLTINRDFDLQAMDPATMQVYLAACVQAGFPPRQMLEAWKAGGRLPPDADLDQIEAEMLAGAAAIAEQQRIDQEARDRIPA
jgi:hypothetical protein